MARRHLLTLALATLTACTPPTPDEQSSEQLNTATPPLPTEEATPTKADAKGWTFLSSPQGLPPTLFGVSADEAGNLWVAGGNDGVFVQRAGETTFKKFSTGQKAIAIEGGPGSSAFVGYEGKPGCDYAFDTGGAQDVYKSGDADRVWLNGDKLEKEHYDISSPAGVVAAEPQGREKLCSVFRIAYDAKTKSVWFGANHGVAWGSPTSNTVIEHTHPAINGYRKGSDGQLHYTLLSGDYNGLAVTTNGDVWLGGRERTARFPYGTNGNDFFAADTAIQKTKIDVWPDAVPQDPSPTQEVADEAYGFAPMPDGSAWVGSFGQGVAVISAEGSVRARFFKPLIDKRVTAMFTDPTNNSVWIGQAEGGLTRAIEGAWVHYDSAALGKYAYGRVMDMHTIRDAQGKRKLLVAFSNGGIGVYAGE